MGRAVSALHALLLLCLPFVAGCLGQDDAGLTASQPPPGLTVPPSHLAVGTFYAFHHAGGSLGIGVAPGGSAQLELFGADDQRIGILPLSDALADGQITLQAMPEGDYVVRTLAIDGTLRIDSGGAAPALRPLAEHVERRILVQAKHGPLPLPAAGVPSTEPAVTQPLDVPLLRAPTSIRILVDGTFDHLALHLGSRGLPIVEVDQAQPPLGGSTETLGGGFVALDAIFHGENVKDGHLVGQVQTQGLKGALVLEAHSYSRAEPLAAPAAATTEKPHFVYGALDAVPVRFQTGTRATHAVLQAGAFAGGNVSWVSIFQATGQRLGTWAIPSLTALAIPLQAGTSYIAVRLAGNATLGADAAPADFELHPLQVTTETLPAQGAGDQGDYGQADAKADGMGLFAVQPAASTGGQAPFLQAPTTCGADTMVRLVQGNETLGYWDDAQKLAAGLAATRLHDGPVQVLDDGFGQTACSRIVLKLQRFET